MAHAVLFENGKTHGSYEVTKPFTLDTVVVKVKGNYRLNCTESIKPLLGVERPKRVESQRTLIAKKYDLARKAIFPNLEAEPGKLQ